MESDFCEHKTWFDKHTNDAEEKEVWYRTLGTDLNASSGNDIGIFIFVSSHGGIGCGF